MMAEKARLFGDDRSRDRILVAESPADAKRLGRHVRGFDDTIWSARRYDIVVVGNLAEFGQHDDLRRNLLSTAPRLPLEAIPQDPVWGIGLPDHDQRSARPSGPEGTDQR